VKRGEETLYVEHFIKRATVLSDGTQYNNKIFIEIKNNFYLGIIFYYASGIPFHSINTP